MKASKLRGIISTPFIMVRAENSKASYQFDNETFFDVFNDEVIEKIDTNGNDVEVTLFWVEEEEIKRLFEENADYE